MADLLQQVVSEIQKLILDARHLSFLQEKERYSMKRFYIALVAIASCLWVWLPLAHASQCRPLPDFDENGVVDFPDFLLFVGKFGSKQGDERYEDRFDLDGNGIIDFPDFLELVGVFEKKGSSSFLPICELLNITLRYRIDIENLLLSDDQKH